MTQEPDFIAAHKHSIFNRCEIEASNQCGCFYCLKIFESAAIVDWTDKGDSRGESACCPHCGIDSVIGDESAYPVTTAFLKQMKDHWFKARKT